MIKIKDQTIKTSLQLTFLFLASQLIILLIFWEKLPPQLPLFYSRPWGEKQLANPFGLLILPGSSLTINFVNLVLASFIAKQEKLISQLLLIFAAIFNLLCLITLVKIISLVT